MCSYAGTKEPEKYHSAVPMEEEDFPRGSSSVLTPLEMRSAQEKARQDVLFSTDPVPTEQKESLKSKRRQKGILEASPAPKRSRRSMGKMVPSMKVIENLSLWFQLVWTGSVPVTAEHRAAYDLHAVLQ